MTGPTPNLPSACQIIHKVVIAAALGLSKPGGADADPIVIDGSTDTAISIDGDGHILVDIASPNDVGTSHNAYDRFNVPAAGASIDNEAGNARLIVNEVTGADPSRLEGTLEVLGQSSNVVLANPNGVVLDDARFVNVSQAAILTSELDYIERFIGPGVSQMNPSAEIAEGTITIGAGGFTGDLERLLLASHRLVVDGPVRTSAEEADLSGEMFVVTGESDIEIDAGVLPGDTDVDWFAINAEDAADLDDVLIDITPDGQLHAGRIAMTVTAGGAGVRWAGDGMAGEGGFTLGVDGTLKLESSGLESDADIVMKAGEVRGDRGHDDRPTRIAAAGTIDIETRQFEFEGLDVRAGGEGTGLLRIAAPEDETLETVSIANKGADDAVLGGGAAVAIEAPETNVQIAEAGVDVAGALVIVGRDVSITNSDADVALKPFNAASAEITAQGSLTLNGLEGSLFGNVDLDVDEDFSVGVVQPVRIESDAGAIVANAGEHTEIAQSDLSAAGGFDLTTASAAIRGVDDRDSVLGALGGPFSLQVDDDLDMKSAAIVAAGPDVEVDVGGDAGLAGIDFASGQHFDLSAQSLTIADDDGRRSELGVADGTFSVSAHDGDMVLKSLTMLGEAAADIEMTAQGDIDARDVDIRAGSGLSFSAAGIRIAGEAQRSSIGVDDGSLMLTASERSLDINETTLFTSSEADISLISDERIFLDESNAISGGGMSLSAPTVRVMGAWEADDVPGSQLSAAGGALSVEADADTFDISNSRITTGDGVDATVTSAEAMSIIDSDMTSGGGLTVAASDIEIVGDGDPGSILSARLGSLDLDAESGSLNVQGSRLSTGETADMAVTADDRISVIGSDILGSLNVSMIGASASIVNDGDRVSSVRSTQGSTSLATNARDIEIRGSQVSGRFDAEHGRGTGHALTIDSAGDIDLHSVDEDRLAIVFAERGSARIAAANSISNNTGRLISNADLTLSAGTTLYHHVDHIEGAGGPHVTKSGRTDWLSRIFGDGSRRTMTVDFGTLRLPGLLAQAVAAGDVQIDAPEIRVDGSDIIANDGDIVIDTDRLFLGNRRLGTAEATTRCRWTCYSGASDDVSTIGGEISASGAVDITASDRVRLKGGSILGFQDVRLTAPVVDIASIPTWRGLDLPGNLHSLVVGPGPRLYRRDVGGRVTSIDGRIILSTEAPASLANAALDAGAGIVSPSGSPGNDPPVNQTPAQWPEIGIFPGAGR